MAGKMWFGVRGNMRWVPAPAIDADFSEVGWSSTGQFLNGGFAVAGSKAGHKEYNMTWNMGKRDALRPITDYAAGLYDTQDGINLIYFLDPMARDKNLLPQLWASPAQAKADGLALFPDQIPMLIPTPSNVYDYPTRSAQYITNTSSQSLWIPVPPGYVLWLGVHGSRTGDACMQATPTQGNSLGATVDLDMLAVTSDERVRESFSGDVYDGVLLSPRDDGPSSTDTMALSGLICQVLKAGVTPLAGGFISGQGHSGCQFIGKPLQTARSAKMDRMAMSAKLGETGYWL